MGFDPLEFPSLHSLSMQAALSVGTGPLMHLRRLALTEVLDGCPEDQREADYLHKFLSYCPLEDTLSTT